MGTRSLTGLVAGLVLILFAACGSTGGPGAPASVPAASAPASAPAGTDSGSGQACATDATDGEEVAIADFKYNPADLTVPVGTAVAWTNNDSAPHTVTFDDGPDCGQLGQGESTALEFDTPGEYSYFCELHPNMRATVTVE